MNPAVEWLEAQPRPRVCKLTYFANIVSDHWGSYLGQWMSSKAVPIRNACPTCGPNPIIIEPGDGNG